MASPLPFLIAFMAHKWIGLTVISVGCCPAAYQSFAHTKDSSASVADGGFNVVYACSFYYQASAESGSSGYEHGSRRRRYGLVLSGGLPSGGGLASRYGLGIDYGW